MNRSGTIWFAVPIVIAAAATSGASALDPPGSAAQSGARQVQVAQASVQIIAPSAPPPARVETVPPPPSVTGTIWEPGYWSWNNRDWVWVSGHYVQQPTPQAIWQPGHWVQQADGWLWVDGQWTVAER